MNEWIIVAGLVTLLALCALLVSFYALYRALQISYHAKAAAEEARQEAREEAATAIEAMRLRIDGVASEIQDAASLRQVVEPLPATPKACMNLTRRSQALRLRRKGETPAKIAEALSMPLQEVELLVKVHEIVLNTL
jgi:hypothetical protein